MLSRADDGKDRPNRIHWPPILYVAILAAAYLLERLFPLTMPIWGMPMRAAGVALIAAGLAVAIAGILEFRRNQTPVDPTARARVVVASGIYRRTRNPMYVGITLAYAGLGLAFPSAWLLLLSPVMAFALQKLAIEREEAFLERKFGEEYKAYRARVRRWI
jgi:protein-S-isoprenylcysteine O-methyltransferase Ste14